MILKTLAMIGCIAIVIVADILICMALAAFIERGEEG